jgi:hypothetical protein
MHLGAGVIVPRSVGTPVDARKGWVKWLVVQTLARLESQSSSYSGRNCNLVLRIVYTLNSKQ